MAYVQVTEQGWFSRIMSSVIGALIGGLLFIVAFPVLFWNEGRAVQTTRSLEEGQTLVVDASAERVDSHNEHKLVHLDGATATQDVLRDPDFGIKVAAVRLARNAEMFQWEERSKSETRKKLGGGEETVRTFTYDKTWANRLIDSQTFKEAGHDNPHSMPYGSRKFEAEHVTLGAFKLIPAQVSKIGGGSPLEVTEASLENAPKRVKAQTEGALYIGETSDNPRIGDERIRFEVIKPGPLSVIAQQVGDSFAAYHTKAGNELLLVSDGIETAEQMFQAAEAQNVTMTWILRAVGFAMMFFGLILVFKPLSVLTDVVPFIGTLIGAGMGFFAFLISVATSSLTVAIAWIAYRPLLGVPLLLVSIGALYLVFTRGRRRQTGGLAPAKLGSGS